MYIRNKPVKVFNICTSKVETSSLAVIYFLGAGLQYLHTFVCFEVFARFYPAHDVQGVD